jgi:hydroxypyruvate isomerase
MATFAPNISWLFPELPFSQRPVVVAKLGFKALEFPFSQRPVVVAKLGFKALEFGFPSHADIDAIADAQERYGFEVTLFNQDVPVWDEDNRGYLADPSRGDEFRSTLDATLEIIERLNVRKVMLAAGIELPSMTRDDQRESIMENLRYASSQPDR